MRRTIAMALGVGLLAGCGDGAGRGAVELDVAEVTAHPAAYAGREITVRAGYYTAFEISVLTTGFAESYPPRPVDPLVWVVGSPPARCTEAAEGARWADEVAATGTFRFDPAAGFGHLGAYRMALQSARLACG
jgi:hypothetical protein